MKHSLEKKEQSGKQTNAPVGENHAGEPTQNEKPSGDSGEGTPAKSTGSVFDDHPDNLNR